MRSEFPSGFEFSGRWSKPSLYYRGDNNVKGYGDYDTYSPELPWTEGNRSNSLQGLSPEKAVLHIDPNGVLREQ
jgi:hypothetical protein